ncbi:MAG: CidA/LrgA family protein [Parvibaculales bacterium]
MQLFKISLGFFLLALYFSLGMAVQNLSGLPVPAGIWGLMILFISFIVLKKVPESLRLACAFMIRHMPFLFLPALVSLISYREFLKTHGLVLFFSVIVSTILGLALAGLIFERLSAQKNASIKTERT